MRDSTFAARLLSCSWARRRAWTARLARTSTRAASALCGRARRGAAFFVQNRALSSAFPWDKFIQYLGEPLTTWVRKDGTPEDPTHGLKASRSSSRRQPRRYSKAPKTLAQILDEADKKGGRPKGMALKSSAEIAVSTRVRRYSSPDVIGVIEGSDPKLKDQYVALMGHVDHIGVSTTAPEIGSTTARSTTRPARRRCSRSLER